ncbi:MAG: hypothetical protein KJN84_01775, partial [Bacteroidia bacterium]|nr:hypothetical protein [Bacteroidia bacterium]
MKEDHQILIEKYFSNSLSNHEQIEFDRLLKNDKEFKDEIELYNSLENHLEIKSQYSSQIDTIKSTVSSAHKQNGSNQKKKTLIS